MKIRGQGEHLRRYSPAVNLLGRCLIICLFFVGAAAFGQRLTAPVSLDFPDFPFGVAVVDLGQSLTINVDAQYDGGKGVMWSCEGDACAKLTSTSKWTTFYAGGITGTANITATSLKQPSVHKTLKVTVYLNEVPNMLCEVSSAFSTKAAS